MHQLKEFIRWYQYTAKPIGFIVLALIIAYALKTGFYTTSCYFAKYGCESAYGAEDVLAQYMSDLVGANQGVDIVSKKRVK